MPGAHAVLHRPTTLVVAQTTTPSDAVNPSLQPKTYTVQPGDGLLKVAKELAPDKPFAGMHILTERFGVKPPPTTRRENVHPGQTFDLSLNGLMPNDVKSHDLAGRQMVQAEQAHRARRAEERREAVLDLSAQCDAMGAVLKNPADHVSRPGSSLVPPFKATATPEQKWGFRLANTFILPWRGAAYVAAGVVRLGSPALANRITRYFDQWPERLFPDVIEPTLQTCVDNAPAAKTKVQDVSTFTQRWKPVARWFASAARKAVRAIRKDPGGVADDLVIGGAKTALNVVPDLALLFARAAGYTAAGVLRPFSQKASNEVYRDLDQLRGSMVWVAAVKRLMHTQAAVAGWVNPAHGKALHDEAAAISWHAMEPSNDTQRTAEGLLYAGMLIRGVWAHFTKSRAVVVAGEAPGAAAAHSLDFSYTLAAMKEATLKHRANPSTHTYAALNEAMQNAAQAASRPRAGTTRNMRKEHPLFADFTRALIEAKFELEGVKAAR